MRPTIRRPPPPSTQSSKIGQTELGNRGVASAAAPNPGQGNNRIQISTYFTKVPVIGEPTAIIYNGDRLWARVTVNLETAGPVAVGQMSKLAPVLGGGGQLLDTGKDARFDIAKGDKLYIAATSVSRVKLTVESLPWLEQITGLLMQMGGKLVGKLIGP